VEPGNINPKNIVMRGLTRRYRVTVLTSSN
jgi:hypothetical protein